MNSKASGKFLLVNSWIIALLIVVGALFYFSGLFDLVVAASERCHLGDGLTCSSFSVNTDQVRKASDGNRDDFISLTITNQLGQHIYNLSILSDACFSEDIQEVNIAAEDEASYNITHCKGIKPRGMHEEKIEIRYTTIEGRRVKHLDHGYIKKIVESPAPEPYRQKIADKISLWMQKNVG
jgi:hypothetical protein